MYFFQSSPVSYKRFIKRFPTENSLIKLYAKTCVDFKSYICANSVKRRAELNRDGR